MTPVRKKVTFFPLPGYFFSLMRLGCLFALVSFIALTVVVSILCLAVEALSLGTLKTNPEGIGRIVGYIFFLFIGPYVFIRGYREQRRAEKEREASRKENLRPLKLDGLKNTLNAIEQNSTSKLPPRD